MRRRNCSSSGLDRTRASPATGPAGPQGGLQARGSFVSGQRMATARRLSLPSTCFVGGHLVELTIPAALGAAAGEFGDGPALAEPGGPRISYHQLLHQTTTVTRALIAEGVRPGDRVAIWSPNTHHWVLGAFGGLSAGATLVPVSTRFTGPEALDVISRSGASVLIVADRFLGVDRFAALRHAAKTAVAEAARAGAATEDCAAERSCVDGPLPGKLRLVVRVLMADVTEPAAAAGPGGGVIGWAELLDRAGAVPASAAEQR